MDKEIEDKVNNPSYYVQGIRHGTTVVDVAEKLSFNLGNAIKYLWRAGRKDKDTEIEDLQKALWYVDREYYRLLEHDDGNSKMPRKEWLFGHQMRDLCEALTYNRAQAIWDICHSFCDAEQRDNVLGYLCSAMVDIKWEIERLEDISKEQAEGAQ